MKWRSFLTIFVFILIHNTNGSTYRAAVFDHKVVFPYPWAMNRATAVAQMMVNLKIYEENAHIAGKEVGGNSDGFVEQFTKA